MVTGEGTLTIDGKDHAVSAGTAAYIPSNSEHGIRSTGDGPLRLSYAFAGSSFDEIEYRFTEDRLLARQGYRAPVRHCNDPAEPAGEAAR